MRGMKALRATAVMLATASVAHAQKVHPGGAAPSFKAVDTRGRTEDLAAYRGRWVVLEWFSFDCPFTQKHYNSGNMQRLQSTYTERGVVWLSLVSSAPSQEGYRSANAMNARATELKTAQTAIIRDTSGVIGRLYGATNTPQLVVIDPRGTIVYMGGIDDKPTTNVADIATAHNFVAAALEEGLHGKPISTPAAPPYGCTVQY